MKLIVGLGNPGKQYARTRHNIAWHVLAPLYSFTPHQKFQAHIARPLPGVLIALPQTFMNNSGKAVASIANFYTVNPEDIWIIHDEIDLPLGTIRVNFDRSAAGHRGVASVIESLGTQEFWRIRIGIQAPSKGALPTDAYVLQPFTPDEQPLIQRIVEKTQPLIRDMMKYGITEQNQLV